MYQKEVWTESLNVAAAVYQSSVKYKILCIVADISSNEHSAEFEVDIPSDDPFRMLLLIILDGIMKISFTDFELYLIKIIKKCTATEVEKN